jgi:hypothetical protein
MLREFIDFVDSVLPCVSPDVKDEAKEAILQFEKTGNQPKYMMLTPLEQLFQGDILSKVKFSYFEEDGTQKVFAADAMVLSTSCHVDQKERIVLVPVLPIEQFPGNSIEDLKKNVIFDYMYIPDSIMSGKFVDFEYMSTYSKDLITNGIDLGRIKRLGSLNQLGYYFFIVKLTVYLMRKEDSDTLYKRSCGFAY